MEKVYLTKSREETQTLGEAFARRLHLNKGVTLTTIALFGELGSGKTTFVQGLARGLGIKRRIISPTFILIRPYTLYPRSFTLYHIDLYRIENEKEVGGLGLEEIINDPQNIVVIEWAEKMKSLLPKDKIDIYFEYIDTSKRRITFRSVTSPRAICLYE